MQQHFGKGKIKCKK